MAYVEKVWGLMCGRDSKGEYKIPIHDIHLVSAVTSKTGEIMSSARCYQSRRLSYLSQLLNLVPKVYRFYCVVLLSSLLLIYPS